MSDDLIALLKAHNPEPAAVEAPPIESLLARLDRAPFDAQVRSRTASRAHRRSLAAAALATAAVVVVTAALVVGIGGERAGVVQEARAAVAAHGAIVYTVTRTTFLNPDGSFVPAQMQGPRQRSVGVIGSVERWSAESPVRWRSVTHVLPYRGSRGGTSASSYANGVVLTRLSWEGRNRISRVPRGLRPPRAMPAGAALLAGVDDPLQTVRTMLDEGEVRRAGETARDGRRVLRLVADVSAAPRPSAPFERTVYLIDAESYAPVEVERRLLRRDRGHLRPAGPIVRIRFERYERLPMTPENERLLGLAGK